MGLGFRASVSGLVGSWFRLAVAVPFPRCWWHCRPFPFFVHSFHLDVFVSLVCFRLPWLSGAVFFPRTRARSARPFVLRARSSLRAGALRALRPLRLRPVFPTPRFSAFFCAIRASSVLRVSSPAFSPKTFFRSGSGLLAGRPRWSVSGCSRSSSVVVVLALPCPGAPCAWCACARSCLRALACVRVRSCGRSCLRVCSLVRCRACARAGTCASGCWLPGGFRAGAWSRFFAL